MNVKAWVDEIIVALDEALYDFGDYTFRDKGPSAVMDVNEFAAPLLDMDPREAGQHLQALNAHPHRHARRLAQAVLGQCDSSAEDWWEACCENCPDVEY